MFHPVGSQPPSVYWRRRFALLASVVALIVLVVLTLRVALSNDPGKSSANAAPGPSSSGRASSAPPSTSQRPTTSASSSPSSDRSRSSGTVTSSSSKPSPSRSTTAAPAPCASSDLGLAAGTDQTKYSSGADPVLSIVVTNKSDQACVQDLADPQIVLRVYNGESRVWGSHDCKIVPGTDDRTLMAGSSVRVSINWTGLSSEPKCAGSRQRVGAGTYTLFASLSGHNGRAAQFTIG